MVTRWKVKAAISAIGIFLVLLLLYWLAGPFLPFDFSQDYRKIQGSESIVFVRNGWNRCYKRSFWGLKRRKDIQIDNRDNAHESDASLELLEALVKTDNKIRQAIYSPDKKYILYCEIQYGYTGSGVTDDEYCYYRVYEIEKGKIITIYQAYRGWYNLFWE